MNDNGAKPIVPPKPAHLRKNRVLTEVSQSNVRSESKPAPTARANAPASAPLRPEASNSAPTIVSASSTASSAATSPVTPPRPPLPPRPMTEPLIDHPVAFPRAGGSGTPFSPSNHYYSPGPPSIRSPSSTLREADLLRRNSSASAMSLSPSRMRSSSGSSFTGTPPPVPPPRARQRTPSSSSDLSVWRLDASNAGNQAPEKWNDSFPTVSQGAFCGPFFVGQKSANKTVVYHCKTWTPVAKASLGKYTAFGAESPDVVWAGTKDGSIDVLELPQLRIITTLKKSHMSTITHIWVLREFSSAITLSAADGKLNVWNLANLAVPTRMLRTVAAVDCAVFNKVLYVCRGRNIHLYDPLMTLGSGFQMGASFCPTRPDQTTGSLGDITCGSSDGGSIVLFGHKDGRVSVLSDCMPIGAINTGIHAIAQIAFAPNPEGRQRYFVGTRSGSLFDLELEIQCKEATLRNQWKLHNLPISRLLASGDVFVSGDARNTYVWHSPELESRVSKYVDNPGDHERLIVKVLSWNLDASTPDKLHTQILQDPVMMGGCDVLAVGFQEILPLEQMSQNAKNFVSGGESTAASPQYDIWKEYLKLVMEPLGLRLVTTKSMVGLFSCIFVHHDLLNHVSAVSSTTVKTGMGGNYGNKGGIITRMSLFNTSFSFLNCHLAAGHTSVIQRNKDAEQIVGESKKGTTEADVSFFYGDTNYRITGVREQVDGLMSRGEWEELRNHDQLFTQLAKNPAFCLASFKEAPIAFPPTYKFDPGTDKYDTSDKKRVPAWCDRVLYRGSGVGVDEYKSLPTRTSDHRAVFCSFNVLVSV